MEDRLPTQQNIQQNVQIYNPSEILSILTDNLAKQNTSSKVIFLRGIYFKQKMTPGYAYAYDILKDENDQQEITLLISPALRDDLKDGSLVHIGGTLTRKVSTKGYIQLVFKVTRAETVKDVVISEDDIKRTELRNKKSNIGYKNVDSLLEDILFKGERQPRVALVFASTSITMSDFNAGKDAASAHIEFREFRVPFSQSADVVKLLTELVAENCYDAIALIRGGGGGIEALDDIAVLESVVSLSTPLICAVGHVEEKIFIKNLADKVAPTPNGLGTYFSNMVENVIQKRNSSRAVLVEQVKGQYIKQIETAEKQNKALQEQIEKMTKASKESQENFKTQSEAMNKQMVTLQESLKSMQKTHEDQAKAFNDNLSSLQNTNKQLQESLNNATAQTSKAVSELTVVNLRVQETEKQLKEAKSKTATYAVIAALSVVAALLAFIL